MIPALRAETTRLLSRRITLIAMLALLALIGLYQLQVSSQVKPPSAAQVAESQREYEEYVQDWEAHHEEWEADCLASGETPAACESTEPDPADWGLKAVPFDQAVSSALSFAVYLGGLALFVVAASFVGAEASTGALANWLTFVPDRTRVLASKLVVATVFGLVAGTAIGLLTVVSSSLVTRLHGQPLGGLAEVAAMAGRGVIVAAIFAVLGVCVGLLTFSTGASIGILLGGLVLVYVRTILGLLTRWAGSLTPWSPELNLEAILSHGATYTVTTGPVPSPDMPGSYTEHTLTLAHGLGYWAVLLAALVVVAWAVFRRRDIT